MRSDVLWPLESMPRWRVINLLAALDAVKTSNQNTMNYETTTMKKYSPLLLALLSLFAHSAFAADADLLRCRGISDASARLACYDSLANALSTGTAAPASGSAAAKVEAPAARGSTSVTAVTAAPTAKTGPEFGFEDRSARGTTDKIESRIVGFFAGWTPNSRIKLENGQVWQVSDDTARDIDANNPKVWVRRGALGAFYLEIEGKNHSPRVKRVE